MKRISSFILSALLLLVALSVPVFAADDGWIRKPSNVNGTSTPTDTQTDTDQPSDPTAGTYGVLLSDVMTILGVMLAD